MQCNIISVTAFFLLIITFFFKVRKGKIVFILSALSCEIFRIFLQFRIIHVLSYFQGIRFPVDSAQSPGELGMTLSWHRPTLSSVLEEPNLKAEDDTGLDSSISSKGIFLIANQVPQLRGLVSSPLQTIQE